MRHADACGIFVTFNTKKNMTTDIQTIVRELSIKTPIESQDNMAYNHGYNAHIQKPHKTWYNRATHTTIYFGNPRALLVTFATTFYFQLTIFLNAFSPKNGRTKYRRSSED